MLRKHKFLYYLIKIYGISGLIFFIKYLFGIYTNIKLSKLKNTFDLRINTTDIYVFKQIFIDFQYNIELNYIPEIIIDCGANIGLTSIFFSNKFPDSKIYAIEPEKNNFDLLVKNTSEYENIVCSNNAIFNETNILLNVENVGLGEWGYITNSTKVKNNDLRRNMKVYSISVSEIMNKYKLETIDLLKIDVEGSEKELFESNYDFWLPRTKCIVIELHDNLKKGCSKSFFNAINKYDFSLSLSNEILVLKNLYY
jgi:FkbM family methyltransferase